MVVTGNRMKKDKGGRLALLLLILCWLALAIYQSINGTARS